jgi:hypothetical protein
MNPSSVPALPGNKDAEHLRILSIFHYVIAGLTVFGMAFLLMHFFFMNSIFSNAEVWEGGKSGGGPPPREFLAIFVVFYIIMGVLFLVAGVLNLMSARFLTQRRHRTFSLVVAGMNCLQVPLGTALGVFTIIVLSRDSVRLAYGEKG